MTFLDPDDLAARDVLRRRQAAENPQAALADVPPPPPRFDRCRFDARAVEVELGLQPDHPGDPAG